ENGQLRLSGGSNNAHCMERTNPVSRSETATLPNSARRHLRLAERQRVVGSGAARWLLQKLGKLHAIEEVVVGLFARLEDGADVFPLLERHDAGNVGRAGLPGGLSLVDELHLGVVLLHLVVARGEE